MPERSILLFVLTSSVSLIKDINSLHKPVSQREEKYPQLQRKYHFYLMIKTNQCERRHKAATRKFWWVASYKSFSFPAILKVFCFVFLVKLSTIKQEIFQGHGSYIRKRILASWQCGLCPPWFQKVLQKLSTNPIPSAWPMEHPLWQRDYTLLPIRSF